MWCYQKPGFEALLLTELQRQQQCSQFCDTLLKAGGINTHEIVKLLSDCCLRNVALNYYYISSIGGIYVDSV